MELKETPLGMIPRLMLIQVIVGADTFIPNQ
jgi:hypothetical protein